MTVLVEVEMEPHGSGEYHEEAVSTQNYGPIIVACTPEYSL